MNKSQLKKSDTGVRHQRKLTITIPEDMWNEVKTEADKKAMPAATWIRVALLEHLERRVSDTCPA